MRKPILILSILLLMFLPAFGQVPMPGPVPAPGEELTLEQQVDWLYRFFSQLKESICNDVVRPEAEPDDQEYVLKAIISGNLGSPEDRIPAGENVVFHSGNSDCGYLRFFASSWAIGKHSGGEYLLNRPIIVGSEGAMASFRVPQMSAPIDQEVLLTIVCGEHTANARATAYLRPVIPGS